MKAPERCIRVMIVDDHQTMVWGLSRLIDSAKPRMEVVCTARNCEEAVASAAEFLPDIVLLDLDLKGQSSLEIIPSLVANPLTRVLLFTGDTKPAVLDLAVRRGARGILHKDTPAEQVLKAIERTFYGELWLNRETLGRVLSGMMEPIAINKLDPEADKHASLTARERKIIQIVVEGRGARNKTLAEKLFISEYTLRNHLTSVYHKLGVNNRLELYVYAVKHRLGANFADAK
ncbi:MAG: response regulator transcription factor [Pseudomonadota bacterium]